MVKKMINYERAHKLYCMIICEDDTDAFINAPLLLSRIEQFDHMEIAALNEKLNGKAVSDIAETLGLKRDKALRILSRTLRKMRSSAFNKDLIVAKTEWEMDILRYKDLASEEKTKYIKIREHLKNGIRVPIEHLDLTTRESNGLRRKGIETVNELVKMPAGKIFSIRYLGFVSVSGISDELVKLGFAALDLSEYKAFRAAQRKTEKITVSNIPTSESE